MADFFPEDAVVYSFGINNDVSWDFDVARKGIPVFMYDHTIDQLSEQHPSFHFFLVGIEAKTTPNLMTLSDIILQNGHDPCENMILKMDIEGAEYDIINTCDISVLNKSSQIVIAWLNILEPSNNHVIQAMTKINSLFQCIHIHGQNVPSARLGHKVLPDFLEATYLRKKDFSFTEEKYTGPLEIDYPTVENSAEIYLGDYTRQ